MKFRLVLTNLAGGGAERSMLRLAQVLARRGHGVSVLLLEDRIEHEVPPGVEVHTLTSRAAKGFFGKWRSAARLESFLKTRLEGDLVVSTLPFADEVAVRADIPNLWCRITNTLSEEITRLPNAAKQARRLARYRKLYEGRSLIAVSDGVTADLRDRIGLERAHIVRIYNGFDFGAIRAAAATADADVPREPFVLHVGRFSAQKRHDLLLDAWQRADLPYRLVLLAAKTPALEAMIEERKLAGRVLVAGFRANPYPWMRAAELLVLSSDREGLPSVLVEALICGTRVVSTDCPSGPREVLRGDLARWLVPVGDAQALAAAMRLALQTPRPGPEDVPEDFREERMASAYEALAAKA